MWTFVKPFSLLLVVLVFLVVAFGFGTFGDVHALSKEKPGFARIAEDRWLCLGLIGLIVAAFVTVLWSGEQRRAYQLFWGGVFVGLGVAIVFSINPGFGVALIFSGSNLAGPRKI